MSSRLGGVLFTRLELCESLVDGEQLVVARHGNDLAANAAPVTYTQRIDEASGEDIIWIISARKAERREAKRYHEA